LLQLVQPAFQKMLTHLRMKALEKFKAGLNSSLESGKEFAISARDNTECSLKDFEQGCAGKHHILVIYSQALVKLNPY
jgi:protein SEY1